MLSPEYAPELRSHTSRPGTRRAFQAKPGLIPARSAFCNALAAPQGERRENRIPAFHQVRPPRVEQHTESAIAGMRGKHVADQLIRNQLLSLMRKVP